MAIHLYLKVRKTLQESLTTTGSEWGRRVEDGEESERNIAEKIYISMLIIILFYINLIIYTNYRQQKYYSS